MGRKDRDRKAERKETRQKKTPEKGSGRGARRVMVTHLNKKEEPRQRMYGAGASKHV